MQKLIYNARTKERSLVDASYTIPLELAIDGKLSQLRKIVISVRQQGMPFTFNGTTYHMQTERVDIDNWTAALNRLYRMSDPTQTHWVRTKENTTIYPTVAECITLMEQAQDYYYATLQANGNVKDSINSFTDVTALQNFDVQAAFNTELQTIINA